MLTRQGSRNVRKLKCDNNGKLIKKNKNDRFSVPAFLNNRKGDDINHFSNNNMSNRMVFKK